MQITHRPALARIVGAVSWQSASCNAPLNDRFGKAAALGALLAVVVIVLPGMLSNSEHDNNVNNGASTASAKDTALFDAAKVPPGGEVFIGAYGGVPYTYNSDVKFKKTDVTDLTVKNVAWDGRPFKSPIYYGIRVARWSDVSPIGAMLDFTHGKVYSQNEQVVELEGKREGKALPPKARIKDIFNQFEFTHGHNMLTLNGLYRLPQPHARLSPYVGAGFGIALPHTEVQFKGSRGRTYEYQYTGPVFQFLIGMEIRIPRLSYFFEYKLTVASYEVPLTKRDGGYLPGDLYRQFKRWWSGKAPKNGFAYTTLVSHQLIGGMGVRISRAPVGN